MIPIRPLDLVRLRHTPEWTATVLASDEDGFPELALVEHWASGDCRLAWVPIELLELVPGQIEAFFRLAPKLT